MKFTFNKHHFIVFLLLFGVEVLIATYLKSGFIRHTVGDFLVTILVYCFLRSFIQTKPLYIALATIVIAFATELLQLTNFLELLGLDENRLAKIVFGTSFSVQDLVAYTLGVVLIWVVDRRGLLGKTFQVIKPMTQQDLHGRINESESDFQDARFKTNEEIKSTY